MLKIRAVNLLAHFGVSRDKRLTPVFDARPDRLQIPRKATTRQNRARLMETGVRNDEFLVRIQTGRSFGRLKNRERWLRIAPSDLMHAAAHL